MAKNIKEMDAILDSLRKEKPDGGIRFIGLHFGANNEKISGDFCKVHRAIEKGVLKPRHISAIGL